MSAIRPLQRTIRRVTERRLPGSCARDHGRELVIKLMPGDTLVLYPKGRRLPEARVKVDLIGLYCSRQGVLSL